MLTPEQERILVSLNRKVLAGRRNNEEVLKEYEEEWRLLAELQVHDPNGKMEFNSPTDLLASKSPTIAPKTSTMPSEPTKAVEAPKTAPTPAQPEVTPDADFLARVSEQVLEEAKKQGSYDKIMELKKSGKTFFLTICQGFVVAYRPLLFKDRDIIVESDPPLDTQRKVAERCTILCGDKIFLGEESLFGVYTAMYNEIMKVSSLEVELPFPVKP